MRMRISKILTTCHGKRILGMGKLAVLFCVLATLVLSVLGNEEQAQRDNPGAYFHDPQNVHNKE